ncbi:class I SAM-dependent methyltransferase [Trichocoleus sp. FACHB-591]|uniref:class I SAM-dependent methyltransferase n=1 Tax=Trichocoleus sp. FACHB-591 TaxID=2692872 RepID=UPI001689A532|nr:class I SAM-dependent methyltransferase [Trichocoleus sp. FACHB-591]MBD2094622.1 class I SAM-dependent methyltransferase [Trichocoleus sp. FACHB-591]
MSSSLQQATIYLAQQNYDEAIALCEQAIATDSTSTYAYWYLGLALLLQDRESEAQATWLSAIAEVQPEQVEASTLELLGLLSSEVLKQEAKENWHQVWAIRQQIYELTPQDANNLLAMALLPAKLGSFWTEGKQALADAATLLQSGVMPSLRLELLLTTLEALNPLDRSSLNLFEAYLTAKVTLLDSFTVAAQQLMRVELRFAEAYYKLGLAWSAQGQTEDAIAYLQRTLAISPTYALAHVELGNIFLRQCEYELAIEHYQAAIALQPDLAHMSAKLALVKTHWQEIHTKGYQFNSDFFTESIPTWQQYLQTLAHKPGLQAIEIGSFEGHSACWLLDNILSDKAAHLTCLDTFQPPYNRLFDANITKTGAANKVTKLAGKSQEVLRSLPLNTYDLIYIDGSHVASDVLEDGVISWRLIKLGGLIIFDDYDYIFIRSAYYNPQSNSFQGLASYPSWSTKVGVDAFLSAFEDKIQILHKGHQVIVRKIAYQA